MQKIWISYYLQHQQLNRGKTMIKTFKYKKLSVKVKTTQTQAGIAYFGAKDIPSEIEGIYKKVNYKNGTDCPSDIFVVEVFKGLKANGIAPFEVSLEDSAYRGVKLTELSTQKTLENLTE